MADSLPVILHTKLSIPPVRAELVARPRLIERFDAGLTRPLTLICAPPGFGKTTLVSEWHASEIGRDFPLAWVSLDEDDNDPSRFMVYLITALASLDTAIGEDLLAILQSQQPPPPKVILTTLISRLEGLHRRFALVLDDYHRITAQVLHDAVIFLLEHLPTQMCLVLISRDNPPLPLSRLRGRDQLAEIRADDLRFMAEEAALFLHQMLGVNLSVDQVTALDTRTEGWIAGLQLAALAMKGRGDIAGFITAFTGSHRYILDYLMEEVLSRQPEHIQTFLLQTSILNRLSSPLCDAITDGTDGQALLKQIERSNLFLISLDDERYWYRYHHLFGEMLRRNLEQTLPDMLPELHRRASAWFEQNGWVAEAVEHALMGHNDARAAGLIERYGESWRMRGEVATVLRWLEALPEEALVVRPKLGLNYAFMLSMIDSHMESERRVTDVERVLSQQQVKDDVEHTALLGQAATIRATLSLLMGDDGDKTIAAGRQALTQLPEAEMHWRVWVTMVVGVAHYVSNGDVAAAEEALKEAIRLGEKASDVLTTMIATSHLSRVYVIQGHLRQAEIIADRLLHSAIEPAFRGQALVDRSQVYYEHNNLAGTLTDVIEAQQIIRGYLLKRISIDGCLMMARLKQLQGDEAEVRELMRQAVEFQEADNLKQTFIALSAWQGRLWLMQGDLVAAGRWAEQIELTAHRTLSPAFETELEHMTLARIQIAQGRLDEAQQLLARLLNAAEAAGRMGRVIEIMVIQVVATFTQGKREQALDILERALSLAELEGYIRIFVDEGAPMEELLIEAESRGIAPDYVGALLRVFAGTQSGAPASSQQWIGNSIEPLSERELDVLRLIADGASNREIAQQLFVSLGTVKRHLNNIFVKLDAHSRTQAVAVARQHNLL